MGVASDLTGMRFGRLVALKLAPKKGKDRMWECACDCGSIAIIRGASLSKGATKSCGCYRKEVTTKRNTTHGSSKSHLYSTWCDMKRRCVNPSNKRWGQYGGRGISVCDRWNHSFENFVEDMGYPPFEKAQLDRIDNNGNYEPGNTRWVTQLQNIRNRSITVKATHNGETLPISVWAERAGISYPSIRNRLRRGWSLDRILTTPTVEHCRNRGREQ